MIFQFVKFYMFIKKGNFAGFISIIILIMVEMPVIFVADYLK